MITAITFLPLLAAIVLLFVPDAQTKLVRGIALFAALMTLGASLEMVFQFDGGQSRFQQVQSIDWFPAAGIGYRVGIDGISVWLVVLASFVTLMAMLYSHYVRHRVKLFMTLLLVLETAMIGTFVSLDLILFYTFFELSLVPMYFLITVWGGEKRKLAAAKFFIYTFAGSIFMLIGMVTIAYLNYRSTGAWSFSIVELQAAVSSGKLWAGATQAESLIFWSFAIAFLIKAPSFPFHSWIADTYAEAPVTGPMLSSVMVKMGSYGLLRFCLPLFPDVLASQVPVLMGLAVVGILYGAVIATVQTDIRRMLAYSSVSHMGFILLGIFSLNSVGMVGGSYQQIGHAITATAMFMLVGFLIERRGSAMFADYGGLKARMPIFATLFLISMLASVGLPGLNGFVGEFMALFGAFQSGFSHSYGLSTGYVVFAGLGVVLSAGYLLYMFQQLFYGPITKPINGRLKDLKSWEAGLVGALVVMMLWGGLAPSTFTKKTEASLALVRDMATKPVGERPTWGMDAERGEHEER